jgi:predicted  nucleic acid-binding Zn-ribbon protein
MGVSHEKSAFVRCARNAWQDLQAARARIAAITPLLEEKTAVAERLSQQVASLEARATAAETEATELKAAMAEAQELLRAEAVRAGQAERALATERSSAEAAVSQARRELQADKDRTEGKSFF